MPQNSIQILHENVITRKVRNAGRNAMRKNETRNKRNTGNAMRRKGIRNKSAGNVMRRRNFA